MRGRCQGDRHLLVVLSCTKAFAGVFQAVRVWLSADLTGSKGWRWFSLRS
ncbi:hypothetical protein [Bartonella acomydis]